MTIYEQTMISNDFQTVKHTLAHQHIENYSSTIKLYGDRKRENLYKQAATSSTVFTVPHDNCVLGHDWVCAMLICRNKCVCVCVCKFYQH